MNRDDDFIGRLEDYLEFFDGASPLPERVRDAVHADLPRTRQVKPALGTGRMLDMISRTSTRARWGLVGAAVVAAVLIGAAVLNDRGVSPGIAPAPATPTPAPTSTPVPTPEPTLTLLGSAPAAACVSGGPSDCTQAGTYGLSSWSWPALISLDVPAGWFSWQPADDFEGMLVSGGSDATSGSGWGLMFIAPGAVSRDPCDPAKGTFGPRQTSTVDGLVTAMRSWPGFKATPPTPITVGGHDGQLIELTSGLTTATCPNPILMTTAKGGVVDAYPIVSEFKVPHAVQFRIVDVNGTPVVIRTTDFPETSLFEMQQGVPQDATRHKADQVELHRMLDSIKFGRKPDQP